MSMNYFAAFSLIATLTLIMTACSQNSSPSDQPAVQPEASNNDQQNPEPVETVAADNDIFEARNLALIAQPQDVRKLVSYLSSPDPLTKRYAIYGLQIIGDPQNAPAIYRLIKDPDRKVQLAAIESIGKLGNPSAVSALTPLLESDDIYLRYQVIMALGRIGDPASAPDLTKAMKDQRIWLELPTWDAMSLFNVIAADFYSDDNVKSLLYDLLDYPSWNHSRLADLEPARRESMIWIIPHRAAMILAVKYNDASGESFLLEGLEKGDYEQQDSAVALAAIKSAKAIPGLTTMLQSQWHNNKIRAINAMGNIGDSAAIEVLTPLLSDDDPAICIAAVNALENIDGRKIKISVPGQPAKAPTENIPETPGNKLPPQFIVLGVDDCASIEGLERMVDICRTLDQMGSKAVFTMWVAPLSGDYEVRDIEKQKFLLQLLFNYGCEFANHTLHHNPGGRNWHSLSREIQVEEVEGCTRWLQDNIDGFDRPFSIKYGGGGRGATMDREFTNSLVERQNFLYSGRRGQHPNEQRWPYEQKSFRADYIIETGCLDGNAPDVHAEITNPITSDYPGRFDYDMTPGLAMWTANFDYKYNLPHRPIIAVNAFHDWGLKTPESMTGGRLSHLNESALLKAFLIDVLVTNKDKYPDTYCVTFRQVMEYALTDGDLPKTLDLGNGQDKRKQ